MLHKVYLLYFILILVVRVGKPRLKETATTEHIQLLHKVFCLNKEIITVSKPNYYINEDVFVRKNKENTCYELNDLQVVANKTKRHTVQDYTTVGRL